MNLLKSLILLLVCASALIAQPKGTIRGLVTDSTSGEALAFANVLIEGLNTGSSTNIRGYFIIRSIPANKEYSLLISYVGYKTKRIHALVRPRQVTELEVQMAPNSFELQTVEKIGERTGKENAIDLSLEKIAVKDIEMLPKGIETDVMRSIQLLPGVQFTGDVSARYFVRGGAANQNLVLLNGVTIFNPFHALGLFSVVDPEMISNVEFYKGGFGAEYSGRISSVLNLVTKDGNKYDYHAKAGVSLLSAKASVEGPSPHGSFIITGRKSISNKILGKFLNDKNVPIDFYDASFKINYANDDVMEDAKFTLHGFVSSDYINNNNPKVEDFRWKNSILGIKYFQMGDAPLFYEVSMAISHFDGELIQNQSAKRPRKNVVDEMILMADFTYVMGSKDEISVGWHIKEFRSSLLLYNYRGLQSDIGSHGSNISVYGKYKLLRYKTFGMDAGTRVNLTRYSPGGGGTYFLEPRLSMTYRFSPKWALKGTWGIFQQDLTTLSDENEVITLFDPWLITPRYLDPARSFHYIAGIDFDYSSELNLKMESYYKLTKNFPFLNEKRVFQTDPELISGTGESYGLEFSGLLNNRQMSIRAGYTLGWSFKDVAGRRYAPRYDSRHNFNISADINLGKGWRISGVWTYSSGLPFTQFHGYYNKMTVTDIYSLFPKFKPVLALDERNLARMPDYHRLDLSVSKKLQLGYFKFIIDFSILNVYNRKNLFYLDRNTGARVNMLPILPSATLRAEL